MGNLSSPNLREAKNRNTIIYSDNSSHVLSQFFICTRGSLSYTNLSLNEPSLRKADFRVSNWVRHKQGFMITEGKRLDI